MNWLALLLPLLMKFLEWFIAQNRLTPKQKVRVGTFLARVDQVRDHADNLGIKPVINGREEAAMLSEIGH